MLIRPGGSGIPSIYETAAFGPVIPAMMAASAVVSAAGSIYSGISAQQSASYGAQVARNNAAIAGRNSDYALSVGLNEQQLQGIRTGGLIGEQKAASAANNLDVNSGSAVDVRAGSAIMGAMSNENIRNNAARQAYGFRVQQESDIAQGTLDSRQGTADLIGGALGATGDLLSGAAKSGSLYSELARTGARQNPLGMAN